MVIPQHRSYGVETGDVQPHLKVPGKRKPCTPLHSGTTSPETMQVSMFVLIGLGDHAVDNTYPKP